MDAGVALHQPDMAADAHLAIAISCRFRTVFHRILHPLNRPATHSHQLRRFQNSDTGFEMSPDCLLNRIANLWATELPSLSTNPVKASDDPRSDHRPFEFGENGRHLHHRSAEWSGPVNALLFADQRHTGGIQFRHGLRNVQHASPEPVHGPDQDRRRNAAGQRP